MNPATPNTIILSKPDDWHVHLRDGAALETTVAHTARQFGRAIVMPNLAPPVTNTELAQAYYQRIQNQLIADSNRHFAPLMTLYLTDNTQPDEIKRAKASGIVHAVKLYPSGATTNSDAGVTDIEHTYPALEAMAELGMPLLIHGEVTAPDIDIFDREKVFIDTHLAKLVKRFPTLKIVLEHITTADAAEFVSEAPANLAATITAHHLLLNRNAMLVGGIHPHYYCLPVLKRERHREALIKAATSGNPKFFLGTDSAPHTQGAKESSCGCAGLYTSHAAIELYATAFEEAGQLDKLEDFASHYGADFYGLPRNTGTITLQKQPWQIPEHYPFNNERLVPFRAGETIDWKMVTSE